MAHKTSFKGWTIRVLAPGAALAEYDVAPCYQTLDALSGHFKIFQYEDGHRFSTTTLLSLGSPLVMRLKHAVRWT